MTEEAIIRILARYCRSKKLRFYAKVYAGRLHKGQERILDGMAFTQEYANMRTIGYEIKTSRADFLQDRKWTDYLPVCSSFYFVCPSGIILPADLPPEIGLIWVEGEDLVIKKKSRRRIVLTEDLQNIFKSLVINRCETERQKTAIMTRRLNKAEKELAEQMQKHKDLSNAFFKLQEELYLFMHPEENVPVLKRRRNNGQG